jgi:hypothetical protein
MGCAAGLPAPGRGRPTCARRPGDDPVRRGRRWSSRATTARTRARASSGGTPPAGWARRSRARQGFQVTFFRSRTGLAARTPQPLRGAPPAVRACRGDRPGTRRHLHAAAHRALVGRARTPPLARRHGGPTCTWALAAAARGAAGARRRITTPTRRPTSLDLERAAHAAAAAAGRRRLLAQGAAGAAGQPLLQRAAAGGRARLGWPAQTAEASGRAWLDHEWSDEMMHPQAVGWDWIGINLLRRHRAHRLPVAPRRRQRAVGRRQPARPRRRARAFGPRTCASPPALPPLAVSPATGRATRWTWVVDARRGAPHTGACASVLDAQELDSRGGSAGTRLLGRLVGTARTARWPGRRVGLGYLEMTGYAGNWRSWTRTPACRDRRRVGPPRRWKTTDPRSTAGPWRSARVSSCSP